MIKTLRLFRPSKAVKPKTSRPRESRQARGYDYDWEKLSERYRHKNPICEECDRRDIVVPVDVVDHKIPVSHRPDLRLKVANLWSLCHNCHNGMKRRMERFAARNDRVDELILWCDDPSERPMEISRRRKKKPEENLMV